MGSVVRATLKKRNSSVCAFQTSNGFVARFFSTEAQNPNPPQGSTPTSPPFLQTNNSGLTYGRLLGVHKHALKTDIINFLEGSNLTMEDVKMEYTRGFNPVSMMLQFPTYSAYDNAIRVIGRKGRLYKLDRIDRSQWDIVTPYDGRTILIQGLPRNTAYADLEQIISDFEYDSSSVNMFLRPGEGTEPIKMATVRFHSRTQAANAFISKNGTYCLNNRITIHVLQ
ncbi:uncharacterized protein LOC131647451 [Vicia villosa]|uniref:uncharacterized protein LOC131647451 n=1 Tax=Vicia villosa TaxID=3911 RepID=UPI00273BA064|nr:uncharacterized protein LOC131647451 [Vicia villosa]